MTAEMSLPPDIRLWMVHVFGAIAKAILEPIVAHRAQGRKMQFGKQIAYGDRDAPIAIHAADRNRNARIVQEAKFSNLHDALCIVVVFAEDDGFIEPADLF